MSNLQIPSLPLSGAVVSAALAAPGRAHVSPAHRLYEELTIARANIADEIHDILLCFAVGKLEHGEAPHFGIDEPDIRPDFDRLTAQLIRIDAALADYRNAAA